MYLKENGIELFKKYITDVEAIKVAIVKKLEENGFKGVENGAKLVIGQCDAAIEMTANLVAQLPLDYPVATGWLASATNAKNTASNALRLGQLMLHLRTAGSYDRNYATLNGGSSAWAVGIVNADGLALAQKTKLLAEALSQDLNAEQGQYLAFDRDPQTRAIILSFDFGLTSFEPKQILESAVRQMEQSILLWNEHFSRHADKDEMYIGKILSTLEPNPAKIGLDKLNMDKHNAVQNFMANVGLETEVNNGPLLGYYNLRLQKYVLPTTEEKEREAIKKEINGETIRRVLDLEPEGGLNTELAVLKALVREIHESKTEMDTNELKVQLGCALAKRKNYLLDLGRVTTGQGRYNTFPTLGILNALQTCCTMNARLTVLKDPMVIKGFLQYGDENSDKFNPATKLAALINNLREKLDSYTKTKTKNATNLGDVQTGKIKILAELIERLTCLLANKVDDGLHTRLKGLILSSEFDNLRVRIGEAKQYHYLFTAVIKMIGLAISDHNFFVAQSNTALGSTNDILQDFLSEAIDFLNGYTIGCNVVFRDQLEQVRNEEVKNGGEENRDSDSKNEGEENRDSAQPNLSESPYTLFQSNEAAQHSPRNSNPESSSLGSSPRK